MPNAPQTNAKSKRDLFKSLRWRKSSSKSGDPSAQAPSPQPAPDRPSVNVGSNPAPAASVDKYKTSSPAADISAGNPAPLPIENRDDDYLCLDAFHVDGVTPGTELDVAQHELQISLKRLESLLSAQRSSARYIPDPQKTWESSATQHPPTTFTALAKELQRSNDASASTLSGKIGSFMVALYPGAKFMLNVAGIGLTAASFAPAQIAANGVAQILEFAMEPKRKTDEVLSGLDLMLQDQHFLKRLQRFPISAIDESILLEAVKLQTALSEVIRESIVWLRKNAMTKFVTDALGLQDVRAAKDDLKAARSAVKRAMAMDFYLNAKLRDLEAQDDKTLDRMIGHQEYIYHLARQRDLHEKRLEDSAQSIVKTLNYQQWCAGDLSTLWCDGLAGAGKTFACSAAVDDLELHCHDQKIGLAFFYCRFEHRLHQSQHELLGALTRQLASRRPKAEIRDKLPEQSEMPLLSDRKTLFKATVALFETVYVVIYAVDEYSESHGVRTEMVEMMKELQTESGEKRCRLCFTSREADDIFDLLSPAAYVLVRASEDEISDYVKQEFVLNKANRHAANMVRQDPKLLQDVTAGIVGKSDCIYQLATLQVRELVKCNTPPQVRSTLENLPNDINEYYKATMERIKSKDDRTRRTLLHLISWVVCSKDGTDTMQLSLALGHIPERIIDDDVASAHTWIIPDLESYVSECEGLLTLTHVDDLFPEDDNNVRNESDIMHLEKQETISDPFRAKGIRLAHETVNAYFRENFDRLYVEDGPNTMIMNTYMKFLRACGLFHLPCTESVQHLIARAYDTWVIDAPNKNMFMLDRLLAFALTWGSYAEEAIREHTRSESRVYEFLRWIDSYPDMLRGWSSIHWCAYKGWTLPFNMLLDSGVDPDLNAQDSEYYDQGASRYPDTPLWLTLQSEFGSESDNMRILRRFN